MARGDVVTLSKIIEEDEDYGRKRTIAVGELNQKISDAVKINNMCETEGFKLFLAHMKEVDDEFREKWTISNDEEATKLKNIASAHREILAWIRGKVNVGEIAKRELDKLNEEIENESAPNRVER